MATVVELTEQARKLELSGYSKLKKPDLEKLIDDELRRRENVQLEAIRQADGPETEKIPAIAFIPTQPFNVESLVTDEPVRRKGLTNLERLRRYLAQTPGRKYLSVAQARQIRKHWKAGDFSVPAGLIYAGNRVSDIL